MLASFKDSNWVKKLISQSENLKLRVAEIHAKIFLIGVGPAIAHLEKRNEVFSEHKRSRCYVISLPDL